MWLCVLSRSPTINTLSLIWLGIFHCRLVINVLLKNWIQHCFWGSSHQGSYNGGCLLSFFGEKNSFPRPQNLVHKGYNLLTGPPSDCYFLDDELPIFNLSLSSGESVSSFLRLVPKSTWMSLEPENGKVVYHGFWNCRQWINFKLLIPFGPFFLLCLLSLLFICLYFSFSYKLALGYFLEWSRWGSCQHLLTTTVNAWGAGWEFVKKRQGRLNFFFFLFWGRDVLSRLVEGQISLPE